MRSVEKPHLSVAVFRKFEMETIPCDTEQSCELSLSHFPNQNFEAHAPF